MYFISDIHKIDKTVWGQFVHEHPQGNVFYTPEYCLACLNSPGYFPYILAAFSEDNSLQGLLISYILREDKKFYSFLTSRSIMYGIPLIKENSTLRLEDLLVEYNNFIKSKAIYSQIRNLDFSHEKYKNALAKNNFLFEDHLNIILKIEKDENIIWSQFSKSRKKGIKKALNTEFSFEVSEREADLVKFYSLLETSYKRIKLPYPNYHHFLSITKTSVNFYKVFQIKYSDEIVVSLFALLYKNTMYGYYMGSTDNEDIIKNKPMDLLFWEVFKWCSQNGIEYFDWMGAGKPDKDYGVRDFKLQFGGETSNFGRYEKHHKPLLLKIGKIGMKLYKKFS